MSVAINRPRSQHRSLLVRGIDLMVSYQGDMFGDGHLRRPWDLGVFYYDQPRSLDFAVQASWSGRLSRLASAGDHPPTGARTLGNLGLRGSCRERRK